MLLRGGEKGLLLWEVSLLIMKSEIVGHLPEVIASITYSNKFKSIADVQIPSAVNDPDRQLTLAHYILMSVKIVPDGDRRDRLGSAEHEQQVRVLAEIARYQLLIVDRNLVYLLQSIRIPEVKAGETVQLTMLCEG
jgi:hypothetical protein